MTTVITVRFVTPGPHGPVDDREVEVAADGRSLMKAAVEAGIDGIAADCGGNLTCATCHVIVPDAWRDRLPPLSADEDTMLDYTAVERQPGSRLSCQIRLGPALDGLVVELPARQY
ncbi:MULTISPECIES: 2Fe-2S iron-sulfur cluster-binding protein [unclassified Tepidimonas]|jgi:2Fe-2S ferredoxin|uniref:2Fe-2S iron-sulfur cluster-binding protein n=1 Tax=unclassified Tepidimonas TaxID=2631705 RepID=UPI00261FE855|nr:2Fe-2S iron-sulfur cluster-binding protein [Tepidimonas sp.]MDT7929206.1 2Fe-2S iron-sulfur cluster-binding protein [Tepidimonas sp.]